MLYYYLDGLEKKGPYNPEELKSRNVTPETLVFQDGMTNWKPIKEIQDLNNKIFETHHKSEIEEVVNVTQFYESTDLGSDSNPKLPVLSSSQRNEVKNIKIPAITFLFVSVFVCVGISYLIVKGQQNIDKKDINKKIDAIFQGKDEICDYNKTGVKGTLDTVTVETNVVLGFEQTAVKAGNVTLAFKPNTPDESNGGEGNYNHIWVKNRWEEYKDVVEYYKCSSGGFTVQTLTKASNGFDLVESCSKNMGFKVPTSRYISGNDYGYGFSTPGYTLPTDRGTVQAAFDVAMNYLSTNRENKSYIAGSYDKIKAFDEIANDFYIISNVAPSRYSSSSPNINAKSWQSDGESTVFVSTWIVWYTQFGRHYEIVEVEKMFNKRWAIFSVISSLLALIIYLLIRYRRKISLQIS